MSEKDLMPLASYAPVGRYLLRLALRRRCGTVRGGDGEVLE